MQVQRTLAILRPERASTRRAAIAVTVAVCAATVWALFVRQVGAADLFVFVRAAREVSSGLTPYTPPGSSFLWSGQAFVYPYLAAWPFLPLTALSATAASAVYYVACVLATTVSVRLVAGRTAGLIPYAAALTAEPAVRALQLGTLNALLLLGLALAWRFRNRSGVVAAALAAVVVAKLFLLPMMVWLVLTRRLRSATAAVVMTAGAVLAGCTLAHFDLTTFVRMLSTLSAHEAVHSSSVNAVLRKLGAPGGVALAVTVVLAVAVVEASRRMAGRTANEAWLFTGCLIASLVLSPIVWSHYFMLLALPPLIFGWSDVALVLTLAATWIISAPVGMPDLQHLHRIPGAHWYSALAVTAVLATGWAQHRRRQESRAGSSC